MSKNERKLYQAFKDKITKADPSCFWYKIPDTFKLGGKKPFDGILVIRGIVFAIEFKAAKEQMTSYQSFQMLSVINAGGEALCYQEAHQSLDEFIETIMETVNRRKEVK